MFFGLNIWRKLASLSLICITFFSYQSHVFANPAAEAWLKSKSNQDGSYSLSTDIALPFQSTSETINALNLISSNTDISTAIQFLNNDSYQSSEYLSRKIVANLLMGNTVTPLVEDLLKLQNNDGGFGELQGYDSTALDTAFALIALYKAGINNAAVVQGAISYLVSEQQADGGFPLKRPNESAVYNTALVSIALQNYLLIYNLGTVIENTSAFLFSKQITGAAWESNWETSIALLSIIPVTTDAVKYKTAVETLRAAQLTDGSWDNDVYITALAVQADYLADNIEFPVNPTDGTFSGKVKDVSTGLPLEGVSISLQQAQTTLTTTSAADGQFTLSGIVPGQYTINYQRAGYVGATQTATVQAGQIVDLGLINLSPVTTTAILSGVVTDSESGLPVGDALVTLSGANTISTTTTSSGSYSLVVNPGTTGIVISASGYDSVSATATIVAGTSLNFSPSLYLAGSTPADQLVSVKGNIIDADTDQAVENVTIKINGATTTLSDAAGNFLVEGITAGELIIELSKTGYQGVRYTTLAAQGSMVNLDTVRLSKVAVATESKVTGKVTDKETGDVIANASVSIDGTTLGTITDSEGNFSLEGISSLSFNMSAAAVGYTTTSGQIELHEHGAAVVNFTLQRAAVSNFDITSVTPHKTSYPALSEAELDVVLSNTGTTDKTVQLYVKVLDGNKQLVEEYPTVTIPLGGNPADANLVVAPNAELATEVEWHTSRYPAGNYSVVIQAFDSVTRSLLAERAAQLEILTTQAIGGSAQFNPPIAQLAANKPIDVTAALSNRGNVPIAATTVTAKVTLLNEGYKKRSDLVEVETFVQDSGIDRPNGMVFDASGNMYVVNYAANSVSKILPDGTVSEYVNNLNRPVDIDIDSQGNIYILNYSNNFVKVSLVDGSRTEVATGLTYQKTIKVLNDGRVLIAKQKSLYEVALDGTVNLLVSGGLANPQGMVVNSQGVVFIANRSENTISKYVDGKLSTYITGINQPYGMAVDGQDNLFVTSYTDNSLIKIAVDGTQAIITNQLSSPYDVKIDGNGNFIVSNNNTSEIVRVTPQGVITVIAGPTIYRPAAAVYDSSDNLYVANASRSNIVKISPDYKTDVVASNISAKQIMMADDGGLDVLEYNKIKHISPTGEVSTFTSGISSAYSFVKAPDGNGYLVSETASRIRRVDNSGVVSSYMDIEFSSPRAMRMLANGDKYIIKNKKIIKVDNDGKYEIVAQGLNNAYGLAVATDGSLYFSEYNQRKILKVDTTGNITEVASTSFRPGAITVTADGKLLVAAWGGYNIYHLDAGAENIYATVDYPVYYDMIADQAGSVWTTHIWYNRVSKIANDAAKTKSSFYVSRYPSGLSENGQGGVFVASYGAVHEIDSAGTVSTVLSGGAIASQYLRGAVSSNGRMWVLSDHGILNHYQADKTIDVRYASLYSPRGLSYSANGNLIVLSSNGYIISVSSPDRLPVILASGSYEHISPETTQTALISNSATVKRLNTVTGEISSIASGYSNIEMLAVNPGKGFAVGDYNRNELAFYDTNSSKTDEFVGLVSPKGVIINNSGDIIVSNAVPNFLGKVRADGVIETYSSITGVNYMTLNASGNIVVSRSSQVVELNDSGNYLKTLSATTAYGLAYNPVGELLFVSNSKGALYKYEADNSYTLLASGLSSPSDIAVDSNNQVYLSDSSKGVVNRVNTDKSLSLYTADLPSASRLAFTSDDTLFVNYSSQKLSSFTTDGSRADFPLDGVITQALGGLAFDSSGALFASVTSTNTIVKLSTGSTAPVLTPGDVIFTATAELPALNLDGNTAQINFGNWVPTDSGDYQVEVTVNDGQTSGTLINNLHVGPTAEGGISLTQSTVFPGDRGVIAYLDIFGADSTSVTSIDADGTTLAASSGANGRAIGADSRGNIYAASSGKIVKITPEGVVSDFVTGITVGNGLAVDSADNIYAVSSRNILKINPQAQVSTIATLSGTAAAVAVDYNDVIYTVDSSNKLSRINADSSIDVVTTVGLNNPKGLTIDAYGHFYVLNSGNKIIRIAADGKSSTVYFDKARFEYEGVNVTADCSNNLLFAPISLLPYKASGEEDIIVQLIGDTGETRQVLYGPSIDRAMSDMDVLFYDRLGKRLLIWTDLQNGKIFSFPVICGGIDVNAHLVTRDDVDLTSTDPAPTNIIDNNDGTKEYVWELTEVDNRGAKIQLNMLFTGLTEGEKRAALKDAYLEFHNSFDLANPVKVAMDIPSLLATTAVNITPGLDATSYGPQSDVSVSVDVENETDVPFNGELKLTVVDDAGSPVAELPSIPVNNLQGLSVSTLSSTWNTALTYAGSYRVQAKLLSSSGTEVDASDVAFVITADNGAPSIIKSSVSTDKPLYLGWDTVQLSSRVRNIASNTIQLPSVVTINVTAPDNNVLFTTTYNVSELYPNSYRDAEHNLVLTEAQSGQYTVNMSVKAMQSGVLLDSSQAVFNVEQNPSQAIKGSVSVSPNRVDEGAAVVCSDIVTNIASTETSITLVQRLANLSTGQVLSETRIVNSILAGSEISEQRTIGTTEFEPGGYACLLSAEINNVETQLGAAGFEVTVPPIKISTGFTQQGRGRLLVLLDEDKHAKDHEDEEHKHHEYDVHGPKGSPSLDEQRSFLEALLKAAGWSYTIVTSADDFTVQMRSNSYVAYALFNEHVKLEKQVQQELRERVYLGESLLVAGSHDERNHYLNTALGIKHKGKHTKAQQISFNSSLLGLTGSQSLAYKDKVRAVETEGASVVAEFDSAKHEDNHDKDHDKHGKDHYKHSHAAVTSYDFGLGKSVYVAFDLLAHATAMQSEHLLDDLINNGLVYSHPQSLDYIPTNVVPVQLTLSNEGIATAGQVIVTLPENVQFVEGESIQVNAEGKVVIPFNLAEDAVANHVFWLRLPAISGSYTLSASVQTLKNSKYTEYEQLDLIITRPVFPGYQSALSEIESRLTEDKNYRKAYKHLLSAQKYVQKNRLEKVVKELVKATDYLQKAGQPETQNIRVMIDHSITMYASVLGSDNSEHKDGHKDNHEHHD